METAVMEESGDREKQMLYKIQEQFGVQPRDIREYSPLALAYIGDGVYELVIRTIVVEQANRPAGDLHRATVEYVKAQTQAQLFLALKEELTEEEADVVRRGRNAKPYTTAKNASRADYHKATGFEALMGWLYLTGQTDRLLELIRTGLERVKLQ